MPTPGPSAERARPAKEHAASQRNETPQIELAGCGEMAYMQDRAAGWLKAALEEVEKEAKVE
jgi:hypothetical protein